MSGDMGTWVRFAGIMLTSASTLGAAVGARKSVGTRLDNLTDLFMKHLSDHGDGPEKKE